MIQTIKNKQGKGLLEKNDVMERWAEYVEDLYKDENRGEVDMGDLVNEVYTISSEEIKAMIKDLQKERPVEMTTFLQNCYKAWGERYRNTGNFD